MKNRDWEERLLDGPYIGRPQHNQIKSIQERVINAEKKQTRPSLKWMVPIALFFGIVACIGIFNIPFAFHQQDQLASTLSNNDILRMIEQGNPDAHREILYKENAGNNGLLIFTKQTNEERKGMTWEVGYFNKLTQHWIKGGEAWVDYVSASQYEEGKKEGFKNSPYMYTSAKEGTPFPILYGALIDRSVSQIRVSGDNGFQQTAKIIYNVQGGFSLWFTFLPDTTDTEFKLEFLDIKGNVIEKYRANVDSNGILTK